MQGHKDQPTYDKETKYAQYFSNINGSNVIAVKFRLNCEWLQLVRAFV